MADLPVTSDEGASPVVDADRDLTMADQMFMAAFDGSTTSAAEAPFLLVKNPTANTKKLYLRLLTLSATTNTSFIVFRLYRAPTITANGTAVTVSNMHIGSAVTSVMSVFSAPTITANGTKIAVFNVSGSGPSANADPLRFSLVLDPNQNILITSTQNLVANSGGVLLRWAEY